MPPCAAVVFADISVGETDDGLEQSFIVSSAGGSKCDRVWRLAYPAELLDRPPLIGIENWISMVGPPAAGSETERRVNQQKSTQFSCWFKLGMVNRI